MKNKFDLKVMLQDLKDFITLQENVSLEKYKVKDFRYNQESKFGSVSFNNNEHTIHLSFYTDEEFSIVKAESLSNVYRYSETISPLVQPYF